MKRSASEENLLPPPALDEGDQASLDNQTNFNWHTGVSRGKQALIAERIKDFQDSSLFFIDELKDQYFAQVEEGCFQLRKDFQTKEDSDSSVVDSGSENSLEGKQGKKDKEVDSSSDTPVGSTGGTGGSTKKPLFVTEKKNLDAPRIGKWSDREHQLFLEGLRRYGKDWPRIEILIGTRDIKSIVSHGQKFLMRLIRFLDGKSRMSKLTREQAEYFCGVLHQRVHYYTKQREVKKQILQKGHIFRVDHQKHTEPAAQPIPPTVHRPEASLHQAYLKWKQKQVAGTKSTFSYHRSLGKSIKLEPSYRPSDKNSFRFRMGDHMMQTVEDFFQDDDSDSAASQSRKHLRRFCVDDGVSKLWKNESLSKQFMETVLLALRDLPDIDESSYFHPMDDVVVSFGNGVEFEVLANASVGNILTHITTQILPGFIGHSHPKLLQRAAALIRGKMDEEVFLKEQGDHPLVLYIASLSPEQIRARLREGITLKYKSGGEEQLKLSPAAISEIGLFGPSCALDRLASYNSQQ